MESNILNKFQDCLNNNITVTVDILYKCEIWNKCECMGQYYPKDDWSIESTGKTIEELKLNLLLENSSWRLEEIFPGPVKISIIKQYVIKEDDNIVGVLSEELENLSEIDHNLRAKIVSELLETLYNFKEKCK